MRDEIAMSVRLRTAYSKGVYDMLCDHGTGSKSPYRSGTMMNESWRCGHIDAGYWGIDSVDYSLLTKKMTKHLLDSGLYDWDDE